MVLTKGRFVLLCLLIWQTKIPEISQKNTEIKIQACARTEQPITNDHTISTIVM